MKFWAFLASLCVFFSVCISLASAYTQVNIYIDDSGNALFLGQSNDSLTLPNGITLEDGKIGGYTSELTQKIGEIWTFSYALENGNLNVIFPQGTVVKNLSSGEVYSIGEQIGIYAEDSVEVSYSITPVASTDRTKVWIALIVIALIAIIYYLLWIRRVKKKDKKEIKRTVKKKPVNLENILHERENLILQKLRETGKTKSSYLRKATNIPKASFSRHIHELEKKKLVKLSGEGKNKFVELA